MNRFPDIDPYEVLGVERGCSQAEIKSAYKKQALKSHPDRAPPEQKEEATATFKTIAEAYEILSDPRTRTDYDRFRPSNAGAGPSATGFGDHDFDELPRRHHGTYPDGHPFSFTWESSSDSARRAHAGRAGRPFGADGFDPFELFNQMFSKDFGTMGGGLGGFGSSSIFDNDPFFQNHRRMADFGGFGFGAPRRQAPPTDMFGGVGFSDPVGSMNMGMGTSAGGMGGMFGGGFTSSSMFSSSGGIQGVSESTSTTIVNGRKETVVRKVDAQGNETVRRITPEGQTVYVNGALQSEHSLLGNARQAAPLAPSLPPSAPWSSFQSQYQAQTGPPPLRQPAAPFPHTTGSGSIDDPIDIDIDADPCSPGIQKKNWGTFS